MSQALLIVNPSCGDEKAQEYAKKVEEILERV